MTERGATTAVMVFARGAVTRDEREYAQRKIEHLEALVRGPVLFGRVELTLHADPGRERPAFAKAELDVNGRIVRAHVAATTVLEAVDQLEARLRERLERAVHRGVDARRRLRANGDDGWRHGQHAPARPTYFPRPVEEREIVRHKTFSYGPMTRDEALADLDALDHDFYLFQNVESGEDNVVARSDGAVELFEPATTMSTEAARDALDMTEEPFVFFLDPEDGRGRVLYRRYDGHYGLILPAASGEA